MRVLFTLKSLLIANLFWMSLIFYLWGNAPSSSRNNSYKENKNLHQTDVLLQTLKRELYQKYPNDEYLIKKYLEEKLPTIFAVTPTYTRWTQKAELTRLCHTFLHVPNFRWIIVEDSETRTKLVENFLEDCGLPYVHLLSKTDASFKMKSTDPNWLMPRGVSQRNEALNWLRKNVEPDTEGVLYFVDDDNTYSLKLFEEMRFTKTVSVWPVGIVGGLKFEGPICKNGKVVSWYTSWKPERPFPIDMAGFAVNIKLVLRNADVAFSNNIPRGYQESHFLSKVVSKDEVEAKADDCSKILVWHTRTEKPKMKQESKLQAIGKGSDPDMEV